MIEPAILTAAEMEKLSPNERAAAVRERMVTDLDTADPKLVAWARKQAGFLLDKRRALLLSERASLEWAKRTLIASGETTDSPKVIAVEDKIRAILDETNE